ncbi:hypothetical protein ACDQ55_07345 [Chitinophaga sp. 30R24]|uniref:hypothetical protein n=1 Tax=Chitinophaga sp. 30R24 TaxID=3248838 RepID=UPI003B916ACD
MNYKKFIIFSISFCLVFFGNVIYTLSCGPIPDPYDYYVSFYNPHTKGTGYEPFYYTALTNFYDDPTPSEETANVIDWQQYTGREVNEKDIREFIYTYTPGQFSAVANGGKALPDSVMQNTFTQFLLQEGHRDAARYLLFAKSCEPAVLNVDPWSAPDRNIPLLENLYQEGEQLYVKTKDKHIRDRYAFQLIRLRHYSKQYQEAVASFDKLFAGKANGVLVYYKALALKAGALFHLGDSVQSAYLFSRVFEKAPSLRISCFISLNWTNTKPEQVYSLCQDSHEKAVVATVFNFANPEPNVEGLRQVYALDPASPALNVLLGREINKLEDDYFSPYLGNSEAIGGIVSMHDYTPEEKNKMSAAVGALQSTVDSILREGRLQDPDLWRVASAYLSYIRKDYPGATTRLLAVKTTDPAIKDQWEIIHLLVDINQQKDIDSVLETRLLKAFEWLDSKLPASPPVNTEYGWGNPDKSFFFRKTYRNLLFAVLAPRYHRQGDLIKEVLIRGRCDSLNSNDYFVSGETAISQIGDDMKPPELIQLHDFLRQPVKTPYEAYLAGFFPKSINLEQVIGRSYLRVYDFSHARNWFKRAPVSTLAVSYQVFREQLQDFGEDTAAQYYNQPITELAFCDRMLELQEQMKRAMVAPKVYYDYATALFSLSYYGRTWFFMKDYRPSTKWYTPQCDRDAFEKQYFGCYEAESYYLKAAQASTDKEFKARCAFMASRCSQKHTAPDDPNKYISALVHNRYFPLLTDNYGQTKFYQQVYPQCSYLRDYIKSTRKQ